MVIVCGHRGQKIIGGCAVSAMCLSNALKREHISKIPTTFVSAILLASISLVLPLKFCHPCIWFCLVGIFKARQFYQYPYLLLNEYLRCYFLAAYLMALRSEALWFSAVEGLIPIWHTVGLPLQQNPPSGTLPAKLASSYFLSACCLHTLSSLNIRKVHTHTWKNRLGRKNDRLESMNGDKE